jgi:uncharacterized protein YprB with RNaseH-like and TPR domain
MGRFDRFFDDYAKPDEAEQEDSRRRRERARTAILGLPEGSWIRDGVYLMEFSRRIGEKHGRDRLARPDGTASMRCFGARNEVVFLDLETTGLSGGVGTYAFLCGLGMASGDMFKVMEFFLEGPAKEANWLDAVNAAIPPNACIVTYNGAAFDIPLLRTRHVLARITPPWDNLPHIDLLRYTRKLYRGYLESCSLGSIEKHVLGVWRGAEDIPGAMIPALYSQFLRTGDAGPLSGVFYHNEMDIVSLAVLYCRVSRIMDGGAGSGRELVRAGDMWLAAGRLDRASRLWSAACSDPVAEAEARVRMGMAAKRNLDYASARDELLTALRCAERVTSRCGVTVFAIREELAKIEEHVFKSPKTALEHAKYALLWISSNRRLLGRKGTDMHRSMTHRRERLMRKISATGDEGH